MSDRYRTGDQWCSICGKLAHFGSCDHPIPVTPAAETPSESVPTMEWFTNVIVHLFDEGESSITELEKLAHEFLAKVRILHAAATRAASAAGPSDEALSIIDGLRRYTTHASDCALRILSAITCSCGLTAVTLRAIELGGGPSVGDTPQDMCGRCGERWKSMSCCYWSSGQPDEPDADALTLETMAARLDNNALFLNDGAELYRIAARLRASAAAPAGTPRAVTDELNELLDQLEAIQASYEDSQTDAKVLDEQRSEVRGHIHAIASRSVEATGGEDAARLDWLEANRRDLIASMAVPEFESPRNPQGMTRWCVTADGGGDEGVEEGETAREAIDAARRSPVVLAFAAIGAVTVIRLCYLGLTSGSVAPTDGETK